MSTNPKVNIFLSFREKYISDCQGIWSFMSSLSSLALCNTAKTSDNGSHLSFDWFENDAHKS